MSIDKREWQIGEVLGLLEETHRSKDWILQEIKAHEPQLPVKSTMSICDILDCCPIDFINNLAKTLKGNDIFIPDVVQTKTFHWFFSDIVAGSNPLIPTKAQVSKIVALNDLILQTQTFKDRDLTSTIILPTGDGQAIGFGDNPEKPLLLAIELHNALNRYNESKRGKEKLLLRIGIESGQVYFVKDLEGKDNVWGPGIIMTRRVMDLCGDTQIFVGSRIAEDLIRLDPKYKEFLHKAQDYVTKYGEKIALYNVYGEGFGNRIAPEKQKKTSDKERKVKLPSNFKFNEIEVMLEVVDPKTMLTHHTWMWDITNISDEPKSRIFYYLDGQIKQSFGDLNVKVVDGDKNRLEIGAITRDMPYRKEFYVILNKPVLPKQKIKLMLKYDWEQPDRLFQYQFASGAKKFNYICTVPKEIDLKSRILKIDTATGYKVHATPPSTVKRLKDRTVISWGKSNIIPQDAYQFYW